VSAHPDRPLGVDPRVGVERADEVVAARERFRRVIGAVSALPPKQRQVIVRHAVDGDSHERIATDLGMSAGAIRELAHRARRTLREAAAARRAGGAGRDRRPPGRRPPLEPRGRRRHPHRGGQHSRATRARLRPRHELGFARATSLSEGLRAEYEWVRRRVEAEPEKALRKAG
jgi:hypothetical protein